MLAALRDGREPDAADPGGTLFETVRRGGLRPLRAPLEAAYPGCEPGLPSAGRYPALLRGQDLSER